MNEKKRSEKLNTIGMHSYMKKRCKRYMKAKDFFEGYKYTVH